METPKQKKPRLYHKKSRTGCIRCRARRVKCDESKPTCRDCNRHGVSCTYENAAKTESASPQKDTSNEECIDLLQDYRGVTLPSLDLGDEFAQQMVQSSDFDNSTILDMPETKSRRLLELRILMNYVDKASREFGECHDADVYRAWSVNVPLLALHHENLFYEILSISTHHLLKSGPNNQELVIARQSYHGLAMREHRKAVAKLSVENADAVCCTSSLIFIDAFASLQDRALEPYAPPMEWIWLARGAGSLYAVGIASLIESNTFEHSTISAIAHRSEAYFSNGGLLFEEKNRKGLLELLSQDAEELWNAETQQAYEKTLSYIGFVQQSIHNGEHRLATCRKLVGFAVLAPKTFIKFVAEKRPRALVILAHLFALGWQLREIWWIGDTPRREVLAIQQILPAGRWQQLMKEPLMRVGVPAL